MFRISLLGSVVPLICGSDKPSTGTAGPTLIREPGESPAIGGIETISRPKTTFKLTGKVLGSHEHTDSKHMKEVPR